MRTTWIYDADGLDFDNNITTYVYRNRAVNDFLENEKSLGIASIKGFGKTFLLKVKRRILQGKSGIMCLPHNTMVDVITSPKFSKSVITYFEDYNNWILLWKVSITVAIINNLRSDNMLNIDINKEFSDEIKKLININKYNASEYFSHILMMERKDINKIFEKTAGLFNVLRNIHIPIYMFIDKIDQALSNQAHTITGQTKMSTGPRNASFWQYAQLALGEVAYEILAINPHIKINYSIRSEALIEGGTITDRFENIKQYLSNLKYSTNDLEKMYNNYISLEADDNLYYPELKGINASRAFVGMENIDIKYVNNMHESIFNYILRHTFMRPRDIMTICYNLYIEDLRQYSGDNLEKAIRKVINRESQIILENYVSETERFLFNITRDQLNYICQFININVLDKRSINYACKKLNESIAINNPNEYIISCKNFCEKCDNIHPFCQLYNLGLLGTLWNNRMDELSIRFNNTNENTIQKANHILPDSDLYFLHPCFASKIEHIRKNSKKKFDFVKNIFVGNDIVICKCDCETIKREIPKYYKDMIDERIFVSSTCHDLENERKATDNMLSSLGFEVIRSDADNFNSNLEDVHGHDHCIDELLKCKRVVFIIGKRYGCNYSGTKYKEYAEEIANIDANLSEPSISFMEYYIARKNKIPVQVFVDSEVYNERLSYIRNKNLVVEYHPAFAEDNRIFHIISYITNQKINNWFRIYNDLDHLKELINIVYQQW